MPDAEIGFRYQILGRCKTVFSLLFCDYNHPLYTVQFTSVTIRGITAALIKGPCTRILKAVKVWSKHI